MSKIIPVSVVCLLSLVGCSESGDVERLSGTGVGTILTFTSVNELTSQVSGTTEQLNNVTFASGLFVVVGAGGVILTSPDGVNWTTVMPSSSDGQPTTQLSLYDVTYGASLFVAVGGNDLAGSGALVVSTDGGKTWSPQGSDDNDLVSSVPGGIPLALSGVVYANGEFVAVGNNQVFYCTSGCDQGANWTGLPPAPSGITAPTVDLFNVAYGNNLFVAVGTYNTTTSSQEITYWGLIASSPDGINWTILPYTADYLSGVAYGGGKFVAVGRNASILTSVDGTTWTTEAVPSQLDMGQTPYLISVIYAGGQFVATGNYVGANPSTGFLLTSPDGETWAVQATGPNGEAPNVYGIAYAAGTFVAVGGGAE